MIQSVFVWLISVTSEVLVQKLLCGFEHESFKMHCVVLVTTVVGPLGIWRAHGENVQNFKASVTHGPDWVSVVKMYTLKVNERYSRKQLTLNNCIQFFLSQVQWKFLSPWQFSDFDVAQNCYWGVSLSSELGKVWLRPQLITCTILRSTGCKIACNNLTCLH